MMKLSNTALLVFILLLIGCKGQETGGKFSKHGVSFTYPSGWGISDQEDIEGGFYLSIEKSGFDQSGLFMFTSIYGNVGTESYLQTLKEGYAEQTLLKNKKFGEIKKDTFNGIECISSELTFSTLGVKHRVKIYVFEDDKSTYAIIKQEAIEDVSINQNGFEIIENSFRIE